jgi:hypothetical protein
MTYQHNNKDPNLNNLHHAMEIVNDIPHVRVTLGSDTITINGDVNLVEKVKLWDGTNNLAFDLPNNDAETAPWSLPTESHNMVFNGSTWDRMRGNITDGLLVKFTNTSIGTTFTNTSIGVTQGTDPWKISKDSSANSTSNRIFVDASGTVTANVTFPATQAVTGTFWQTTQPVSIATMPTTPVTGTFWQTTQPVSLTTLPDNNVTIKAGSATIGKVDQASTSNPWVISKNSTVNSSSNPLDVTFTNTSIGTTFTNTSIGVTQGTTPWQISKDGSANSTSNRIFVDVGTPTVTVNQPVAVTDNNTTLSIDDGGGVITVDGTVELGTTTLAALETTTANQGTGGASAWRISANNTDNSSGNPIYVSANIANSNPITVAQSDVAVTAFDEPISIPITPVIQADAQYGLDPDFWVQTKLRGGDITVNANNTWEVASGTSPGGYARLATSKYMSYQSGQGSLFRWTAAFTATGTDKNALGVNNIVQNTGPVDREDGYTFGYSGSTANDASRKIGILHRRNGKVEIRALTFTVGPGGNQTAVVTLDGTAYSVAITSGDIYHAANQVATALKAITTATNTWDIEGCNGVVTFSYYSPGARTGTFSFSSSGAGTTAVAAFSQTAAGTTPSDTWTYVDQWDNQTIQFDPTKLNVFQIDMRWLGAGRVRFFMEDPATGKMTLVHTKTSSSQQIYPHINKPALRIAYRSGTTNPAITPSQNVIVRGSSVMTAVQGTRTQTGSSQGRYNVDSTTRAKDLVWHLMSVQNPFVRAGGVNKASLMIQTLTVAAQGQDPSVIYVVKDAFGLSDVLAYIAIPNTTPAMFAQYSVSAVSADLSTQRIANVQTLGINDNATFDLGHYNLTLAPGETISVFISSSNALSRTATGLTWLVD